MAKLNPVDSISPSAAATPGKAYLYGVFEVDRGFMNATRLWLRLDSEAGQSFEILFADGSSPQAIEVDPGTYRIRELLFTPGGPASMLLESEVSKIPLPATAAALSGPVRVEAGKGYYLGDFLGTTERNFAGVPVLLVTAEFKGSIVGIRQNFEPTTAALKQHYPGLRSLELVPAYELR